MRYSRSAVPKSPAQWQGLEIQKIDVVLEPTALATVSLETDKVTL